MDGGGFTFFVPHPDKRESTRWFASITPTFSPVSASVLFHAPGRIEAASQDDQSSILRFSSELAGGCWLFPFRS
jgi:hypothetical protein